MTPALRLLMEKLLESLGLLEPVVMTWTPRQGKKPIRLTGDPDERLIADVVAAAYSLGRTHERRSLAPEIQRSRKEQRARFGRSKNSPRRGGGRKAKHSLEVVMDVFNSTNSDLKLKGPGGRYDRTAKKLGMTEEGVRKRLERARGTNR